MSRPGKQKLAALAVAIAAVAVSGAAHAQTPAFPTAANAWTPLPCGNGVMVDAVNDTPNATGPLDLVGTTAAPAGFHAADANFLYLRMRLAGDPRGAAPNLAANAWGWELDLDGNRNTYELLLSVSGIGGVTQVAIYRHTGGAPNDPADPATTPPLFTYPFTTHGEAVLINGTSLGGGSDFYVDIALPWADLQAAGLSRGTNVRIWAGSSTVANALDLDLACFGGGGGTLGGIDVGVTTPDPQAGGGGAGGGGGGGSGGTGGAGPRTLEGGPGCSLGGGAAPTGAGALASLLLLAWALVRARARR